MKARAPLEAGLPTLIDKPLTMRSADAFLLLRLSESKGVPLMTALDRHFDPASLFVSDSLLSGALGEVQLVISTQRGFAGRHEHWYADPALGGGLPSTRGCRAADLVPGLCDTVVDEVDAHIRYDDQGVDVKCLVRLNLANGVTCG